MKSVVVMFLGEIGSELWQTIGEIATKNVMDLHAALGSVRVLSL